MLNQSEKILFDKIETHGAPYPLPKDWTHAIRGLWLKNAIVVHNNCARITPDGYQLRDQTK